MAEPFLFRLLLRRLVHAVENHGVRGAMVCGVQRLLRRNGLEARQNGRPHPFDVRHGVDTGGYIPGETLMSGLRETRSTICAEFFSTAYYAISPSTLSEALSLLPEPPEQLTFVDLGCGKGRALLVAAAFGFREMVGVELAPELCGIARENSVRKRLAQRMRVEHADAATVEYPPGPLVIFLYHPFLRPLLRRVLWNLERQLKEQPRPVYLLYANPGYQRTLRQFRWLEQVWDFSLRLSDEDAAADRHSITHERYTLYRSTL